MLPITLIRLFIIYLYGSRYNIDELRFLDVMMHSENKFFNGEIEVVDTIRDQTVSFKSQDQIVRNQNNIKIFSKDTDTISNIKSNKFKIKETNIKEDIEKIKNSLDSISDNSDNNQQTIKLENIETSQEDKTIDFLFTEQN